MDNKNENVASLPSIDLRGEQRPRFSFQLDEMITVNEAAKMRSVTRSAIWDLIKRRRLRVEMVFGRALVYRTEIENFEPLISTPSK